MTGLHFNFPLASDAINFFFWSTQLFIKSYLMLFISRHFILLNKWVLICFTIISWQMYSCLWPRTQSCAQRWKRISWSCVMLQALLQSITAQRKSLCPIPSRWFFVCLFVCLKRPCQPLGYIMDRLQDRASDNFTCWHTWDRAGRPWLLSQPVT